MAGRHERIDERWNRTRWSAPPLSPPHRKRHSCTCRDGDDQDRDNNERHDLYENLESRSVDSARRRDRTKARTASSASQFIVIHTGAPAVHPA